MAEKVEGWRCPKCKAVLTTREPVKTFECGVWKKATNLDCEVCGAAWIKVETRVILSRKEN